MTYNGSVSRENPKPKADANGGATPLPRRDAPVANNKSGRVKHDDRGNAIWEWAVTTGAFTAEASTQRLKKLDNPTLSLAEDSPSPLDVVKRNPLGTVRGYSPYDSGVLAKTEIPRKKDLRKLSEWLKLKKQASNNNPDKE
jgi:hypothetical protein